MHRRCCMQSDEQWQEIREQSRKRGDSEGVCSICLDTFGTRGQVLLACSHTFHRWGLSQRSKTQLCLDVFPCQFCFMRIL